MSNLVEILIFKIPGCPACASYVPRFRQRARPYAHRIPIYVLDANAQAHQELANFYQIQDVPVTIIRRKGTREALRYVGELADNQIDWLLGVALRYA